MSTSIAGKSKHTPYPHNTVSPQLRELDSTPGRVRKPAPSCNCLQQPSYYKTIVASFYFQITINLWRSSHLESAKCPCGFLGNLSNLSIYLFQFSKTRFLCVALAILELTL